MNVDNLMMIMILSGVALCGAYFRAQYRDWRRQQTAAIEEKIRVHLLYQTQLPRPQQSSARPAGVRDRDTTIMSF
jgi:hypothetical protein